MKLRHLVAISAMALLLAAGCSKQGSAEQQEPIAKVTVPVKVATVMIGEMDRTLSAHGQTEALRKETVVTPVAGTVTVLPLLEGSTIEPGDTLAIIETKESQAAVSGAEALLASASTPKQRAEAEHALELAKANRSRAAITTKARGVVSTKSVVEGSVVADGAELVTIIDPASMDFVAMVSAQDLKLISVGQNALVHLPSFGGSDLVATVRAISPETDPQSQTVRVRLEFSGMQSADRRLVKENMAGTARIIIAVDKGVLLVPRAALLRNDETDSYSVVVVTPDSLSKSIPITVVASTDSAAEVTAPDLTVGMPVVVEGHYALADSTRVTVK